ncbi:uncharacterized protein VDAG_04884 [Verticillium dahliae VdLs.17]|uniref:Uncharacterized protein n=1 Tax=Verticillium dahliae (strain VdLs.17 / ATCC MYA-4575 / FGSC 10137) TaxID=498257 RepID=G2X399_VERDV|nr:uncharacterized protein VDAG_04884 [Verticillium dahliae VdLs.17]EGY23446.1 hypothetical protein VDAG_04884 [Verticillium dahliae VdLs.17]KAH6708548.1 hypothetical protein EV126DRAFT_331565 [Verticillium dahliae]
MEPQDTFLRSQQLSIDPTARVVIRYRAECLTGLVPSRVSDHLKRKHDIPAEVRGQIGKLLGQSTPKIQDPASTGCHEEQQRNLGVKPEAMFKPVYLQAWMRNPPKRHYWVVCKDGDDTRPVDGRQALDHLEGLRLRENERSQAMAAAGATATLGGDPAYPEARPWLDRTRWESTYGEVHRPLLWALASMPPKATAQRALVMGCAGTGEGRARLEHDMISTADDEWKIAVIAMAVVSILESRAKYFSVLKRFVAMVFRASRMPTRARCRAARIRLKEQEDLISAVWEHDVWAQDHVTSAWFWGQGREDEADGVEEESDDDLSKEEGWLEGSIGDGLDGVYSEDESDDDAEPIDEAPTPAKIRLHPAAADMLERLFGLIMAFCTEEVTDGRPASTLLVYFSGILGFAKDCARFLPAKSYTPHLAGMVYVQRLLFLEYALPARRHGVLGIDQRLRTDQLPRLQQVRRAHMVVGAQSPFEEMSSLMAYGRVVASSDAPSFLLRAVGAGEPWERLSGTWWRRA